VRVQGEITARLNEKDFFLQSGRNGVLVGQDGVTDIALGTQVDVAGFVKPGDYSIGIEDACVRVIGSGSKIVARHVTGEEALSADGELVSIDGTVLDGFRNSQETSLVLSTQGSVFTASQRVGAGNAQLPQRGTKLRVTGVVRVLGVHTLGAPWPWKPTAFELIFRSPNDLLVLERPRISRAAWVLASAVVVTLVGALWVGTLWWRSRAKVNRQNQERIAREIEFAAVTKERMRLAREIHDGLAQALSVVSIQLEMARLHISSDPNAADEHLGTARQFVKASLAEAREAINELRAAPITTEDFAAELQRTGRKIFCDGPTVVHVDVRGDVARIAPEARIEFMRIASEAMSNAMRHAQAKEVHVGFKADERCGELTVRDNGVGFDANQQVTGHFGLQGMRERANGLGGEFKVTSTLGSGTSIIATIPNKLWKPPSVS
jgi:signal transduction histidine kinase